MDYSNFKFMDLKLNSRAKDRLRTNGMTTTVLV